MKTITEFPSMSLKNAAKTKQELITSGKTLEEMPAALGEALKIEGSRLEYLVAILDIVGTKLIDLKRAIVYAPNEGEKAPQGLLQKGDHFFLVEYFPSLAKPGQSRQPSEHPRNGKGDDKKRGKGNRDGKRNTESKGPGFKRPDSLVIVSPAGAPPFGQEKPPRPTHPRGPIRNPKNLRPAKVTPTVVTGPPIIIKPITPIEPLTQIETSTTKEG